MRANSPKNYFDDDMGVSIQYCTMLPETLRRGDKVPCVRASRLHAALREGLRIPLSERVRTHRPRRGFTTSATPCCLWSLRQLDCCTWSRGARSSSSSARCGGQCHHLEPPPKSTSPPPSTICGTTPSRPGAPPWHASSDPARSRCGLCSGPASVRRVRMHDACDDGATQFRRRATLTTWPQELCNNST